MQCGVSSYAGKSLADFTDFTFLFWKFEYLPDHEKKKMTYVGAGHEYILVYHAASGECEAIMSGGVALGMVPDNSKVISEKEIQLDEGDFIMLYSDGITEAKNTQGELYGVEKLKEQFREYAAQYSAEGVNYHVAKDVSEYMKDHGQEDDMTLIVMQKTDKRPDSAASPIDSSTNWQE